MAVWQIASATIKGKSHEKSGMPNQDALILYQIDKKIKGDETHFNTSLDHINSEIGGVAVVSDGHGSERYFNSHIGSRLAVESVKEYFEEFLKLAKEKDREFYELNEYLKDKVDNIIEIWKTKVINDIIKNTPNESIEIKDEMSSSDTQQNYPEERIISYGATLLSVVLYKQYQFTIQLGDGDILVVDKYGEVSKLFGKDPGLIANETHSLCMKNAKQHFKFDMRRIDLNPPQMILLSTDGYSNSFKDDDSFFKAGKDILEIIKIHGIQKVRENLENWIRETSNMGSGDDTTVIVLHRGEKII
jgi:serine/threonine protein phosphatase PrpC